GLMFAAQLCETLSVAATTMSAVLKNMQAERLLTGSQYNKDRRSVRLALTPKGSSLLSKLRDSAARQFDQSLNALSLRELREFDQLLLTYSSLKQVRGA